MKVYLAILVIAALVTYVATPVMRNLAYRVGAVTTARERDVHTVPTARLGGVAIYLGLVAAIVTASRVPFLGRVFEVSGAAWAVLGGAGLVCLLGVIDDIYDLDWMAKLAGQVFAAWILAWGGVQLVTLPIGGVTIASSPLSLAATMFSVVIAINAVNFADGLDGLAAGMIAIGASALLVYTYVLARDASPGDYSSLATLVLAALVGACLGFLPHNVHPARIFMGDSGAMVLGLTMAAASIIVTGQVDPEIINQRGALVPAAVPIILPIMVVAVPLADMALAVIRRTLRGESPWAADAHHLHHRLLRFGHSHRWAVAVLYIWTAVLSFGTVSLVFLGVRGALLLLGGGIVVAALITFSPKFRDALALGLRSTGTRAADAIRTADLKVRGPRSPRRAGAARGAKESAAIASGGKK